MFRCSIAFVAFSFVLLTSGRSSSETEIMMLSGTGTDDAVNWEFKVSKGRKSDGEWHTIPVPSNWEFHGFGNYNYGHDVLKHDEQGHYRRSFDAPQSWKGRPVRIVFDGVMTDAEVIINGKRVGPAHQGGFYRFEYEISKYLNFGAENVLEVLVDKVSSNDSVEQAERKADYWVFGGIYRQVFLEVLPGEESINWIGVDAKADGQLKVVIEHQKAKKADRIVGQIYDLSGNEIDKAFEVSVKRGTVETSVESRILGIQSWNAEQPNLYRLELLLMDERKVLHSVEELIGFRSIEVVEGEGFFINGSKVELKGVNRHSFHPDTGRALTEAISYEHVRLIKGMNMNAVRMSHYPPDVHFLKACDELGLYVLNELAGWHPPAYDTEIGKKLVREMVKRDVNHPSIVLWDNGNEGGWNPELDDEFQKYDPQGRTVIHPFGQEYGLHEYGDNKWVNPFYTNHYRTYEKLKDDIENQYAGLLSMPTEFLHGLYDGGHGAGLDDYWELMRSNPTNTGGFLWVLADEGAVRTDKGNWIDTDGNHAPDGILGPYGQKEGSYFAIKEIWSPIRVPMAESNKLPDGFDGRIALENDYDFTNLNTCRFEWQFERFTQDGQEEVYAGTLAGPDIAANDKGSIMIELPDGWEHTDGFYLKAIDQYDHEVFTWSWTVSAGAEAYSNVLSTKSLDDVLVEETEGYIEILFGTRSILLDKETGRLLEAKNGGKSLPLANGPQRAGAFEEKPSKVSVDISFKLGFRRGATNVTFEGVSGFESIKWTFHENGIIELVCLYQANGELPYHGISFDLEESSVKSKTWRGQGPYRVWKNRLKGTELGVWSTEYNDTETGLRSWVYPEFKGYFADVRWMSLETEAGNIQFNFETDSYVRLFDFHHVTKENRNPDWVREPINGDISFLSAIAPIGTKFKLTNEMGPQSRLNVASGLYEMKLAMRFE